MSTDLTFTIIKPTAFKNSDLGPIVKLINRNGFKIVAMRLTKMDKAKAEEFYGIHRERPFFNSLVEYMTSGPIVVAALQKENAVADFRELIGDTDPLKAKFGTIRKMFADNKEANAVHGSDSDENAIKEISQFFNLNELIFE
jgi:nucleoside-diphosphate kinase